MAGSSPPSANVKLSLEQTSLSYFLFPLSLIFFFKVYSKAADKLSSSVVALMTSSPSLTTSCLRSYCHSLLSFPSTAHVLASASLSPHILPLTNCTQDSGFWWRYWVVFMLTSNTEVPFLYSRLPFQTTILWDTWLKNILSIFCLPGTILDIVEKEQKKWDFFLFLSLFV